MKILLIVPPNVEGQMTDREDRHSGFASGMYPPYTAAQILSALRLKYSEIDMSAIDGRIDYISHSSLLSRIDELNPDLIICLMGVYMIQEDRVFAELSYPTIGVLCPSSVSPREAIELFKLKTPYFTKSEIENTLVEAVGEFKNKGLIEKSCGLLINGETGIRDTGDQKTLDISWLPIPAFDMFPMDRYFTYQRDVLKWHWEFGKNKYMWMVTSKGCVKKCLYCDSSCINPVYKSPRQVVDELRHYVATYQVRHFDFFDSEFTVNPKRSKDICRLIFEEKLGITWVAHNIVDFADDELMELMSRAGCIKLKYGLETGDDNIKRKINKPWTMQQAHKAFSLTKKYGMKVHANFMVGFLGENRESLKKTYKAFMELKPDIACSSILFPSPGSKFYYELKKEGLLLETNWSEYKNYRKMIFKHDTYSNWEEIVKNYHWLEQKIAFGLAVNNLFINKNQKFIIRILNVLKSIQLLKRIILKLPYFNKMLVDLMHRTD